MIEIFPLLHGETTFSGILFNIGRDFETHDQLLHIRGRAPLFKVVHRCARDKRRLTGLRSALAVELERLKKVPVM
jgi:hypothetical protein